MQVNYKKQQEPNETTYKGFLIASLRTAPTRHGGGEKSVGSCSTCAVRCMLLRGASGSEATRKAELMRNEQDDHDGQTERD
jgi:hypothetical protein